MWGGKLRGRRSEKTSDNELWRDIGREKERKDKGKKVKKLCDVRVTKKNGKKENKNMT